MLQINFFKRQIVIKNIYFHLSDISIYISGVFLSSFSNFGTAQISFYCCTYNNNTKYACYLKQNLERFRQFKMSLAVFKFVYVCVCEKIIMAFLFFKMLHSF